VERQKNSLEENWLELKPGALFSVERVAVNVFAEPPVISPVSCRHTGQNRRKGGERKNKTGN
jgi:hypothetical protein